jgi:hypothetical protein
MVAKTFTKFMEQVDMPADIKELQVSLKKLGYADFKKISSKRFSVLTNENRVDLLEKIAQHFSVYGAVYDQDFGSSSVGMVRIGAFAIGAAPKSKQGKASAGIQNEYTLINMVNTALADGPLNLVFQAKGKKFTVPMAVRAEAVGGDTKDRKKSDVNIIDADGNKFPLSLKKDKAEMWESADSYWGKDMETIVRREQKAGTVKVEPHPKVRSVFTLTPNLAVKANSKELINVVFGTDILPNGCVLEKTFSGKYKVDAGEYEVYFLMRNDSSRKGSKIPGLRVLAVKKSRINKNVKVVNR